MYKFCTCAQGRKNTGKMKMHNAAAKAIDLSEQGLVPDSVIRHGIRRLLKKRIEQLYRDNCESLAECKTDFILSFANR